MSRVDETSESSFAADRSIRSRLRRAWMLETGVAFFRGSIAWVMTASGALSAWAFSSAARTMKSRDSLRAPDQGIEVVGHARELGDRVHLAERGLPRAMDADLAGGGAEAVDVPPDGEKQPGDDRRAQEIDRDGDVDGRGLPDRAADGGVEERLGALRGDHDPAALADMDGRHRGEHFGLAGRVGEAHGGVRAAVAGGRQPVEHAELEQPSTLLGEIIGRDGRRRHHIEKAARGAFFRPHENLDVGAVRRDLVERALQLIGGLVLKPLEMRPQHRGDERSLLLHRAGEQVGLLRVGDLEQAIEDDRNDEKDGSQQNDLDRERLGRRVQPRAKATVHPNRSSGSRTPDSFRYARRRDQRRGTFGESA